MLPDQFIESIERATLDVVVPDALLSLPGWLVPVFDGTVGRAKSAVPLWHTPPDGAVIDRVIQIYQDHRAAPAFRLPDTDAFVDFQATLRGMGFTRRQPTLTMVGRVEDLLALPSDGEVELAERPDDAWLAMFLGPGLDPVDGASRTTALVRGSSTRYASLRLDGRTIGCGAAGLSQEWLSVHGMRTALDQRGKGVAQRVMSAMAHHARGLGIERVFLQVDAGNAPALALYRRAGFQLAWPYAYWQSP